MRVELMRSEISKVYKSDNWIKKVKYMPDEQVIAIYNCFLRNDTFVKMKMRNHEPNKEEPYQITMYDILRGTLL